VLDVANTLAGKVSLMDLTLQMTMKKMQVEPWMMDGRDLSQVELPIPSKGWWLGAFPDE
jgi:hypothetical protein